jgi:hypothetical protein
MTPAANPAEKLSRRLLAFLNRNTPAAPIVVPAAATRLHAMAAVTGTYLGRLAGPCAWKRLDCSLWVQFRAETCTVGKSGCPESRVPLQPEESSPALLHLPPEELEDLGVPTQAHRMAPWAVQSEAEPPGAACARQASFSFIWKMYIAIGEMNTQISRPSPASKPSPEPASSLVEFILLKAL